MRALILPPSGRILACLLVAACSPVGYDFGPGPLPDAGDPTEEACKELPLAEAVCPGEAGTCDTTVTVETAGITTPLGCTPAGMALGVALIDDMPEPHGADIFAWIEPGPGDDGAFADGASLALFAEKCDSPLGGEPGQNCAFRPYLFEPAVGPGQPLFLHVQTRQPGLIPLGLQVIDPGAWRGGLPPGGEPLSCRLTDGQVLSDLVAMPPWDGSLVPIDASLLPPAFEDAPWMCESAAASWRQAAFLLRNQEDRALALNAVSLYPTGQQQAARFHFGLYRCDEDGQVPSQAWALAASCQGASEPLPEALDATVEQWVPGRADTEYVLVIQVPPGPDRLFDLVIDSALAIP